jgi:hypothetical protein
MNLLHGKAFCPNRIVNYVAENGETFPFILIRCFTDPARANGFVLRDSVICPIDLQAEVPYDQGRKPGTFHFPDTYPRHKKKTRKVPMPVISAPVVAKDESETLHTKWLKRIAFVAHETNRKFCQSIGDYSQLQWCFAPTWQKHAAMHGVQSQLESLSKTGECLSPSDSHADWMRNKLADGWKYGPVKDVEIKEHPCLMPYNQLPFEERIKDHLFTGIVEAFYWAERKAVADGCLTI